MTPQNKNPSAADPNAPPKPPSRVHVKWMGDHRFEAGRPGGPTARFDGSGRMGQTPPDGLLSSLASCTSIDVVDILAKRRTPVQSLEVDVIGERVDTVPRRFKHITLNYRISGAGIEREQALRAIELSATKYCSVRDSLSPDITVDWTVEIIPASSPGQP
jgi:putative redox protein